MAQPQRTDLQTDSLFLSLFVQTLVIEAIVFLTVIEATALNIALHSATTPT